MHRIFLLRAFGDFVIFLNAFTSSSKKDQYTIVASVHLKPLYEAIVSVHILDGINIEFVDFGIDKRQLRLFTNKHFTSPQTFKEINAIKAFIQNHPNTTGVDYIEQDKRIGLFNFLTGQDFQFILDRSEVYKVYDQFFENSTNPIAIESTSLKNIVIFPDSRLTKKDIPSSIVERITKEATQKGKNIQVAKFGDAYKNFNELITMIMQSDLVIGADSLPIHIAALLNKPHYILYADRLTQNFMTPFAANQKSFGTFNQYDLSAYLS
jgi:ADP-heptose:LPS heptosyltransferase